MSAARALVALAAAGVEVRAEGPALRLVGGRGAIGPELRAELPAVAPALHLVASGSWRTDIETWPAALVEAWEERAAILTFDGGLAVELAERVAYLETAAPPPAPPPEAPCRECGTFGPSVASGLGSCPGCGAVPRLAWPWSSPPQR